MESLYLITNGHVQKHHLEQLIKQTTALIIVLVCSIGSIFAQDITEVEYFFNTDPGVGQATSLSNFTAANELSFSALINADALSRGIHTLFIRAKNEDGEWGLPIKKLVLVDEGNVIEIAGFEYFFDTDPGVGQATFIEVDADSMIDMTTEIDASALERGIYTLYVRAKTVSNNWGQTTKKLIIVDEGEISEINGFEYFFDTDPGVGEATFIEVPADTTIELMTQISTEGVDLGIHNLFVRARTTSGAWGLPTKRLVLNDKDDPTTISQIVSAEYFFDTDPGFGNANYLELTDASEIDEMVSINVDTVSAGPHTLYVRVLDEDGEWSMIVNQEIVVTIPPQLTNVESDTLFFTENNPAVNISDSIKVFVDGGFTIDSATVTAASGFNFELEDQINSTADLQDSVVVSSPTAGVLTFKGSASASLYQQILRGIEFVNTSDAPDSSLKTITFQVFGNEDSSEVVSRNIQVIPIDDSPERIASINPINLPEDVEDSLAIRFNQYYRDVDSPLNYSIETDSDEVNLSLQNDSLYISSSPDWNGSAQFYLEVESLGKSLFDTLALSILPLNDAPFVVGTINDLQLEEDFKDSVITHLDSLFSDVDLPDDSLRYSINIDDNSVVNASLVDGLLSLSSIQDLNRSFSFSLIATDDSLASDSLVINGIVIPVNDPPFLTQSLPDTSVQEDADQFNLLNLHNYFVDIDSDLTFEISHTNSNIILAISNLGELLVTVAPNWNGFDLVSITAKDDEFELSDTLLIEVQSVNDAAPTQPVLIAPNKGGESNLNAYLVWSLAKDTVEFEDPRPLYEIQIDSSESFSTPVVNQSNIGLSTILKHSVRSKFNPQLQGNPSDEDSVFAVRLGSLEQASQLMDDVKYYWRVRSVDNEDSASVWSRTWSFWLNIENDAPEIVMSGFTPTDSITVSSLNPILSWNAANDADFSDTPNKLRYSVAVSSDTMFNEIIFSDTTGVGKNSVGTGTLSDESIYFWRVMSMDDEGLVSDWSEKQVFIINQKLDPPTAFELNSPVNGVDTLTANPVFSWTSSSDFDLFDRVYYRYHLAEDSLFNNMLAEQILESDTTLTLAEELGIGTYYWKVVAIDTDSLFTFGSNSNVEPFKFTVVEQVASEMIYELPEDFTLSQNYPNPFNPSTTLQFGLPEASQVRLEIFNLLGQKVSTLVAGDKMQAGWHSIQFDASNLSSGVYIYRIQAGEFVQTKRMLLIK